MVNDGQSPRSDLGLDSPDSVNLSIWNDSLTLHPHGDYPWPMSIETPATGRRYKGADPAERVAQRRAKILAAGIDLFATRGYPQTTMAMLSVASGVPHRYLSQLFPSKEDLLREIYLAISKQVMEAVLLARRSPGASPIEQIRRDVDVACRAFLADERSLRINCLEVVGVSQAFEQLRRQVIREFSRLIEDEIQQFVGAGLLPDQADYASAALGLVGAFHELMTEWVLTPASRRPAATVLVEQVQEFFRGMLLAALHPGPGL